MTFRKIGLSNIFILIMIAIFGSYPWYFLMLTAAQIIFVPLMLQLTFKDNSEKLYGHLPYLSCLASLAVLMLQMTNETPWDLFFALIYFVFTLMVAWSGFTDFLNRGFIHLEEFMIDMGMIYLAIGGAWFLAYEANIDTGFSPILTWLTGIHFHYSAFLLPIFAGFLGRLYKPVFYKWISIIVLLSPIIVAIGITFSTIVELLSVIIYIIGIYGLIFLSFKTPFDQHFQKGFIRLSYSALGVSILFSLLYALGNLTGRFHISIDFMLHFHGITNSILFAILGVMGWSIRVPSTNYHKLRFPISQIRGKGVIGEKFLIGKTDNQHFNGLVDNMAIYEADIKKTLSLTVKDFYENTNNYRLFATVRWRPWFKPFAGIYRLTSQIVKQINLPFSSKRVEMTGDIYSIKDENDGRSNVRAWVRKVNEETVFVALYSSHHNQGRTYMNIALPLPWSSMIGILELNQDGRTLQLTSKKRSRESDSGIYLAFKKYLLKLPIEEQFDVEEVEVGILKAKHKMWIFSVPFLTIDYQICKRDK
ncbi:YndJ family protein [Virgibacillus ndiopensis]|uniref:YndJ family protein n=1 Tax=Virgibacillus ndiopensis TaxID=2004408 RepID=UPI000C0841C3|nr:YndJ family protein [Virgibacillus ndiopensis]